MSIHWHTRDTELQYENATLLPWNCGQVSTLSSKSRHCTSTSLQYVRFPRAKNFLERKWPTNRSFKKSCVSNDQFLAQFVIICAGADSTSIGDSLDIKFHFCWILSFHFLMDAEKKNKQRSKNDTEYPANQTRQKNDWKRKTTDKTEREKLA